MKRESIHIIDQNKDMGHLEELFIKIAEGNAILFLGAGASVTNKKFLSNDIIEYYEASVNKKYETSDVTKLVDILEATPLFNRNNFDNLVSGLIRNLKVEDFHRTLASIKWRQIITTNYDLLVEKAYDEIRGTANYSQDLLVIRTQKEYNSYYPDTNEVKYIKINGCLSDKSKYPFVFSTKDFEKVKKYHKAVLNNLRNPSDKITFISIGYSYSDKFSYHFLEQFDSTYRERRIIYNVDPYVNDNLYPYFESNNISIVNLSGNEFLNLYKDWLEKNRSIITESLPKFLIKNSSNITIGIPQNIVLGLGYGLKQINENISVQNNITKKNFYLGEEPNYKVISQNYDVVRAKLVNETIEKIEKILISTNPIIIPLFLFTGTFGTGKTTFTYRLIQLLIAKGYLAFEIFDVDNLKREALKDLIEKIEDRKIIFYTNYIENDSFFKSILSLRTYLSTCQFQNDIIFLSSIRENRLEVYKKNKDISSFTEINIDSPLNETEIEDLIEKLHSVGLAPYRDLGEKKQLARKFKSEYGGDQFVALLDTITSGKHFRDLLEAYNSLSKDCQDAFIYTALLHKYNLLMPSSLLRRLISKDWQSFKENVIEVEGKGILIQESISSKDLDPDLYFKTKHPIIAAKLLQNECNVDKQFKLYKNLIREIDTGSKSVKLVNNLLKALQDDSDFSSEKINNLYDIAYQNLSDEPHFVLNHALNLQKRGGEFNLIKAYDNLIYVESLLERRDDKFIYRRGVLQFELAKIYKNYNNLISYKSSIKDAKELLRVKQLYDPCSSFSYVDLIQCLMWQLKNEHLDQDDSLKLQIEIEELIETGLLAVVDGKKWIIELNDLYLNKYHYGNNTTEYYNSLIEIYENYELKPYACILLYNYFSRMGDIDKCNSFLSEMEYYLYDSEIVKFLFKIYGRNLNIPNIRIKFFDLVRANSYLEEQESLRFYYFMYIAESYNYNMQYAFSHLKSIRNKFALLNPEFEKKWLETDSNNPEIFDGIITKNYNHMTFKAKSMQFKARIVKNKALINLKDGDKCKAHLIFTLVGIKAEIIEL
jgi:adenylylsulfate kinase-like enzyme